MNTLPNDLRLLLDSHLHAYESVLLELNPFDSSNTTKWGLYFYQKNRIDDLFEMYLDDKHASISLLRQILIRNPILKDRIPYSVAPRSGDVELMESLKKRTTPEFFNKVSILQLIENNKLNLLRIYYKKATDRQYLVPHQLIAARNNLDILKYIIEVNEGSLDITCRTIIAIIEGDSQKFVKCIDYLYSNKYIDFDDTAILTCIMKMDELSFLKYFQTKTSYSDRYILRLAIKCKAHNIIKHYIATNQEVCLAHLKHAFHYNNTAILNLIRETQPLLLDDLNLYSLSKDLGIVNITSKIKLDFLIEFFNNSPPSRREIKYLINQALEVSRYDLYCYLCSLL